MRDFFSRPHELSFKDVLAIAFSSTFLYFCWRALNSRDALAVVQTLVPLIGIILGGYFVQESATIWFNRSQERKVSQGADNRSEPGI
jgi:ABC-type enterochelin transport system permease subunit